MNRITNYQQENEDVVVSRILLAIQEQMDHAFKVKSESHPNKRLAKTIVTIAEPFDTEMAKANKDIDNISSMVQGAASGDINESLGEISSIERERIVSPKATHQSSHHRQSTWFSLSTTNNRLFGKGMHLRVLLGLIFILALLIIIGMVFLSN